tara:strand:+ start:1166 stop:1594 length:429 start_codon:yes stop_codon:yes gene_type:complete
MSGGATGDVNDSAKAFKTIEACLPLLTPMGCLAAVETTCTLTKEWLGHLDSLVGCDSALLGLIQPEEVIEWHQRLGVAQDKNAIKLMRQLDRSVFTENSKVSELSRRWRSAAEDYWRCLINMGYSPESALDATMHQVVPPWV